MRKLSLFLSLILILFAHFTVLNFSYEKKKPVILKPKYQKFSIQLAQIKKVPKPKAVEKKVEPVSKPIIEEKVQPIIEPKPEKIIEKKVFKKPIKKEAKRKLVKKKIVKKKPKKKKIKKKVKKKPKKKVIKKKLKKKIVKKTLKKEIKKEVKKVSEKPISKVVKEVKTNKEVEKTKTVVSKASAQSLEKFKKFKNSYLVELRAAIDRNKKYPTASKRLVEEGTATVAFTVLKNGQFQNIRLIKSSGKRRLDKAAVKAVSKTYKFKAFPSKIKKSFIELTVPIKFILNN